MRVDINKYIAAVLTIGMVLSLVILTWGSVLFILHPEPVGPPGPLTGILGGTLRLDPVSTINLGLLVLLITPVARVVAAMIAFALEGDRRYVLICITVLAVLALSAVIGEHSSR